MSKRFAPTYSAELLDNGYDLISGNVKISLLLAAHTDNVAHDFHADLTNILTTSGNLANKTKASGWFDFDDISLGSPASGTGTQAWLWLDTGTSATSPLVYYWDEDDAGTPLSVVANSIAIMFEVPVGGLFRV